MSSPRVSFKKKPRKDPGSALWTDKDGSQVFIGRDYALQNQIDENKKKTQARACFKGCLACGSCVNSRRGCAAPYSYDANAGKKINCIGCEPFRFHDCNNGFLRDTRGDAEEFTEDAQKLIDQSGGKPLME